MKAYGGNRGMPPLILNIGTKWRRVISLTTGENVRYLLKKRKVLLAKELALCFEEKKNSIPYNMYINQEDAQNSCD